MNEHEYDFHDVRYAMRARSSSAPWPSTCHGVRDHRRRSSVLENVGWRALQARLSNGAHEETKGFYERALAAWEAAYGSEHSHVAYLLMGLAEVALEQCRPDDAVPLAQRAVAVWEKGGVLGDELAEARFVLAQALWDASAGGGRDRERAVSLARRARSSFRGKGASTTKARAEVEQWLCDHGRGR